MIWVNFFYIKQMHFAAQVKKKNKPLVRTSHLRFSHSPPIRIFFGFKKYTFFVIHILKLENNHHSTISSIFTDSLMFYL